MTHHTCHFLLLLCTKNTLLILRGRIPSQHVQPWTAFIFLLVSVTDFLFPSPLPSNIKLENALLTGRNRKVSNMVLIRQCSHVTILR